jgi:hypothetical protein
MIRKYLLFIISVILEINSDKEVEFKWKPIQDEFKSLNPSLEIIYLRFNKDQGHIGIYRHSNKDVKFVDNFELNGVKFTITKCEGDNLIQFWKDHGTHFEYCVGRNKRVKDNKNKKGSRDKNTLKTPVKLGNET